MAQPYSPYPLQEKIRRKSGFFFGQCYSLPMKRKHLIVAGACLVVAYAIPWLIWLAAWASSGIYNEADQLPTSDSGIVFGGLHNPDSEMSELNRERLNAAIILLNSGLISQIVVSNTDSAANAMHAYLVEHGVSEELIEIDTTAFVTTDTCVAEWNNYRNERNVVFISHTYHLPRIISLCKQIGIEGFGASAEDFGRVERQTQTLIQTMYIRFMRHQREAVLLTLGHLGIYQPTIEKINDPQP